MDYIVIRLLILSTLQSTEVEIILGLHAPIEPRLSYILFDPCAVLMKVWWKGERGGADIRHDRDTPNVRDRTNEGAGHSTTLESTAMSMEASYSLHLAFNATCLEREGFLASLALRAGTIQQTVNRFKVCFFSLVLESWRWPHARGF